MIRLISCFVMGKAHPPCVRHSQNVGSATLSWVPYLLVCHPEAVLVGVLRLFNEIQDGVFMSFQSWIGDRYLINSISLQVWWSQSLQCLCPFGILIAFHNDFFLDSLSNDVV